MISITYVLLSRTYGMHLYTADLAQVVLNAGGAVRLITVPSYPTHVYDGRVKVDAVWPSSGGTMSASPLLRRGVGLVVEAIRQAMPDVIHISGPQILAPLLMRRLRRAGIPVLHSLHDLDPHPGAVYGRLLHLWNRSVISGADRILVHGEVYRRRLLAMGMDPADVVRLPLLFMFTSSNNQFAPASEASDGSQACALFFGRVARYKGVDVLLRAWSSLDGALDAPQLVIAGQGDPFSEPTGPLPANVERRNRLIQDVEAIALFQRSSVLVLPYVGATQSALVSNAYYFGMPVIATRSGALPEYIVEGETGWLVPEGDATALAQALGEALGDPERCRAMGAAGRAWYDQQRERERTELMQLYQQMAEKNSNDC
jgi:alpha-maltose-1-phosphate synthase